MGLESNLKKRGVGTKFQYTEKMFMFISFSVEKMRLKVINGPDCFRMSID